MRCRFKIGDPVRLKPSGIGTRYLQENKVYIVNRIEPRSNESWWIGVEGPDPDMWSDCILERASTINNEERVERRRACLNLKQEIK